MTAPPLARHLRSPVPRRARFLARWGELASGAAAIGLVALGWALGTPRRALAPARSEAERLAHARDEAQGNCRVAALLAGGHAVTAPWFRTEELQAALETGRVAEGDAGEVATLRRLARWLARLGASEDPGAHSLEDVAFVLGGIHWYLDVVAGESAAGAEHVRPAATYDRKRLRCYREVTDFEQLLGSWD